MALLKVHVHPGARRTGVHGVREDGALKLSVAAPPEDGRANRAVETLLASTLDVARSTVSVVRGHGSRAKVIEVAGLSDEEMRARLAAALEGGASDGD